MIADQLKSVIKVIIEKNENPFPEIEGQNETKRALLSALLAGRNILIEGYPGVGKTTIAKAVAKLLPEVDAVEGCPYHCDPDAPVCPGCKLKDGKDGRVKVPGVKRFIRIQGSPDLQVEDLLGDIDPTLAFEHGPTDPRAFKPGKLLRANRGVLFFDELNRCPERLQNALLQVLEEHTATIGGYLIDYPADFVLIATMNPAEFAGTERLSDVLLDRFDVVRMEYPENAATEKEILLKKGKKFLPVPDAALNAIVTLVRSTRNDDRIESPAGVRATIGLFERSQTTAVLKKKKYVDLDDVREVAVSVLAHRIRLASKVRHTSTPEAVVEQLLEEVLSGVGPPDSSDSSNVVMNMINHGVQVLNADFIAKMLITNLGAAEKYLGKKTIYSLTNLGAADIRKRERKMEYINELKQKIEQKISEMKKKGLLDEEGKPTETGFQLAIEETLKVEGFGTGEHIQPEIGEDVIVGYKKFSGSFRDMALRATIRKTVRRGHRRPTRQDWVGYDKREAERVDFVFLLDASGSMSGEKIEACKKAALSLAMQCNRKGDRMAVIEFKDKATLVADLSSTPRDLAFSVMKVMPSGTTDIAEAIQLANKTLERGSRSRHVILITDAIPTQGEKPIERAIDETGKLSLQGITMSVIGIELDDEAGKVARILAGIGKGKFYQVSRPPEIQETIMHDAKILQN